MKFRNLLLASAGIAIAVSGTAQAQGSSDLRDELRRAQQRIQQLEGQLTANLPPATDDGQCFSRILVPPSPRTYTETIVVEEARTETVIIPAVYDTVTERVIVEDERVVSRVIPAVYDTVTETVVIEEERTVSRVVPAVYDTVTEQVLVEPERVETRIIPAVLDTVTEQVIVEPERVVTRVIPAVYDTITEQVLVEAERVERRVVPAVLRTVTEEVLVSPERVETRIIPAVLNTVTEQILVQPEQVVSRVIPAETRTVTQTVVIRESRLEPVVIPAEYETYTEQVLIREAYFTWQPSEPLYLASGSNAPSAADYVREHFNASDIQELPTGEILCRVEVPAQYQTVTFTRLVRPERIAYRDANGNIVDRAVELPEITNTMTRTDIITDERIVQDVIPARYETITRTIVVESEKIGFVDAYGNLITRGPDGYLYDANGNRVDPNGANGVIVIPARYDTVTRTVEVEPERTIEDRIQARYDTVTRTVEIEPERTVQDIIPARYDTVTRTVEVQPERTVEDRIPARYDTVTRTVEVQPERTVEEFIPGRTEIVTRTVEVQPERIVEDVIPARYENVTTERLVTRAREEKRSIPAVTREITRTEYIGSGNLAWREVLCEINTTPEAIRQIQIGLRDAGFNPGPIDGVFDELTYQAMVAYQDANGLPRGQLSRSFVEHLGVPWEPLTVNLYPLN